MSDLISRQDAIDAIAFGITYAKAIDIETGEKKELFKKENSELEKAIERIKQLPSAEPERKTGHWIITEGEYMHSRKYQCSECGHQFRWIYDRFSPPVFNYCKNCGARMGE